ncbi:uroporphyrinogen-III C-methyltransferase [Aliiglaciecola sp. LCG003]|uniref:uroporphyrinogen-III C-methyltransferase n=1 Tax=Aliiglaciecola sp. LCG003 TaxID=3053655 RepID=UPI0025737EC3|nr:uroporphyrinogen-III C-methyltransferase [Aliiglaciecola sp. LCG003]WJG09575.1 uroporphyrinogen-III C-methyltransferase [Aliiglaciecola sp. LCG003]
MTDKDKSPSNQDEMKALEIENASYIEVEETVNKGRERSFEANKKASKSTAPAPPKATRVGGLWFITLINLILLIGLAAAGYWFWQQWQDDLNSENSAIQSQQQQLAEQTGVIQSTRNELSTQNQKLTQQLEDLEKQINIASEQSAANAKNLADVSGRRPADWLLAEADYLVRMAGRKLWLENDVKTSIAMLQAADTRLQDLADPSLLPIRQFIASDIQTLEQINSVSLTSVALAVSGMVQQVNNLPLALPEVEVEGPAPEELTGMERVLRYISDNFKYQPNSQPIKPLLSQQQQWLAREQLRFALLQAQSAILKEQGTLFKQSVQQAIGLLVQHYDLQSSQVGQFVDALRNLENTDVERNYPTQLDAAIPLQDKVETRMNNQFSNGKFEL